MPREHRLIRPERTEMKDLLQMLSENREKTAPIYFSQPRFEQVKWDTNLQSELSSPVSMRQD